MNNKNMTLINSKTWENYINKLYNVYRWKQIKQKVCNFNIKNLSNQFMKNKVLIDKNTVLKNN